MNNLVSGLQSQLAGMVDANGQPLYGLIAPRLPSVGYQYDPDGFNLANGAKGHLYLKWVDENGQEQTRYYDGTGSREDGTGDTLVSDFMKYAMEAETVRQHYLQGGISANGPVSVDIGGDGLSGADELRNLDWVAAARSEKPTVLCRLGKRHGAVRVLAPFKASNDGIARRTINGC